ncbi:hypothetical protein VU06_02705, partial [Desulfobulbus sp. F3]|nr:hypothetical protein [Desulfobulbus sp. F3]
CPQRLLMSSAERFRRQRAVFFQKQINLTAGLVQFLATESGEPNALVDFAHHRMIQVNSGILASSPFSRRNYAV